jgi:hypothetical protein
VSTAFGDPLRLDDLRRRNLRRAKGADLARTEQILDMVIAIATMRGDTGYVEPILQTALDGLRPRPN